MKKPKIAIVADWLTTRGGAESVVKSLARIFPDAPILTTIFVPDNFSKSFSARVVAPTFLQKLPKFLRKNHPFFLPFLPRAIEKINLENFDIVISSSSFVGKGVLTTATQFHACYCHTPTRYFWGEWQKYLRDFPIPPFLKRFLPPLLTKMRIWDFCAAARPDFFFANSEFIRKQISKFYRRDAVVLPPPVDFEKFAAEKPAEKSDFFLFLGRLAPQKRVELLIDAFRKMPEKKLVIAGAGRREKFLREKALGLLNIEFRGFVPDAEVPRLLQSARALLFPQIEDAGITALEALAAGTPVIAVKKGGAPTLLTAETAEFFAEQNPEKIIAAVKKFEKRTFEKEILQNHAKKFSRELFEQKIKKMIFAAFSDFQKKMTEKNF